MFFMYVLKSLYRNPRPYWVSKNVEAWSCNTDFGNPSGHSMLSMGQAVTLGRSLTGKKRNIVLYGGVAFALLIGFSRVVLGVHGIN
jgi:membrane-associated phospholipid phosphatase